MPQIDIDGANSKISADKLQGQSGTTVTVQSGHNLAGSGSGLTALPAGNLTGSLPAISGASLTGLPSTLNVGVIQGTVDTSTTGSQSFTGLSFTPKGYWVMYGISSSQRKFGLGFTDGSTHSFIAHDAGTADVFEGPSAGVVARVKHTSNADTHSLAHSSFNSNGVTVTKSRTGSITGTANVHFLCWG